MEYLTRGSEWRKWDLHVHTPSSYDYKSKSIKNEDLVKEFVKNNLSAVAITDHNIIDVERINNLKEISGSSVTIFPGIELCTNTRGNDPIHITCIFPEDCNLEFIWDQINVKCKIAEQKEAGKENNQIYCNLEDTSQIVRGLGGLVVIHAGEKSNSIENISNTLPVKMVEKADISKNVDIFEVKEKEDEENYKKMVWKALKREVPIIICSDNHKISEYKTKEACWIKADTSFEGLKQILYEPSERIYLGEESPDEKSDYLVIDKVKFIDDKFSSNEIPLNSNLNTIIGGRSTGKSLLLWAMANAIDPTEVKNRTKECDLSLSYDISNFEVLWKNGVKNSFANLEEKPPKIIYIPQSYLNRLINESEDKTAIDEMVENILLQDEKNRDIFENLEKIQRERIKLINSKISDLCFLYEDMRRQEEKIKGIGERSGIQKEIAKLNGEIAEMQEKLNLEKEKLKEYNFLSSQLNLINQEIQRCNKDISELAKIQNIDIFTTPPFSGLSEETRSSIKKDYLTLKERFTVKWKEDIEIKIGQLKMTLSQKGIEALSVTERITPLESLFNDSNSLKKKMERLKLEEDNLKLLNQEDEILERIKSTIKETKRDILNNFVEIYNEYISAKTNLLKDYNFEKDMDLDINVNFKLAHFKDNFIEKILDGRKLSKFKKVDLSDYSYKSSSEFVKQVGLLIEGILSEELPIKKNCSKKEALVELLKNHYLFSYSINYDGDDISKMSPGKKSLILLKLLIKLDSSKCPILLDQPEDDLDNRSIYTDLVKFIRGRKSERQIIIVTHSPNLVVSADSEEVIVANQEGEKSKNEQYRIEYISGSLEDSFTDKTKNEILYEQGIREHVCDILEGGKKAFEKRQQKYDFS